MTGCTGGRPAVATEEARSNRLEDREMKGKEGVHMYMVYNHVHFDKIQHGYSALDR